MATTRSADITSQVDGMRTTFDVGGGAYAPGSLQVYLNGVRQKPASAIGAGDGDFEELSPFLQFVWSNSPPLVGDTLLIQYETDEPSFPLVQVRFS